MEKGCSFFGVFGDLNCLVIIQRWYGASHLFSCFCFLKFLVLLTTAGLQYSLRGLDFIAEMVLCNPVFLNETKKANA